MNDDDTKREEELLEQLPGPPGDQAGDDDTPDAEGADEQPLPEDQTLDALDVGAPDPQIEDFELPEPSEQSGERNAESGTRQPARRPKPPAAETTPQPVPPAAPELGANLGAGVTPSHQAVWDELEQGSIPSLPEPPGIEERIGSLEEFDEPTPPQATDSPGVEQLDAELPEPGRATPQQQVFGRAAARRQARHARMGISVSRGGPGAFDVADGDPGGELPAPPAAPPNQQAAAGVGGQGQELAQAISQMVESIKDMVAKQEETNSTLKQIESKLQQGYV